jgi:DNA-binding MarR family transcriptional regulator
MERMARAPKVSSPADRGLSDAHYRVLACALANERMNVGDVGRVLSIARSSATEMVARMERDGLLAKVRLRPNSREIFLVPTDLGRGLVGKRRSQHQTALQKVLDRLSDAEGEELLEAVETIGRLLKKGIP